MAWDRINVRVPPQLRRLVSQQAARLGMRQSEYVREALAVYTGWHHALDAIDEGHTTRELRDPETIARLLAEDT